jgi:hypothetical protein
MRLIRSLKYFIKRIPPYIGYHCVKNNFSAMAIQCNDNYYQYENSLLLTDTYSPCWYCKGVGYVSCIFCDDGCSHCNQTKSTPCPYCNKKKFSDFIILTGIN